MLLIRRRRPVGEPAGDASTLDGTRGAGRIVGALAELGVDLGIEHATDQQLVVHQLVVYQLVVDGDATIADLDRVDAGRKASLVVLGSHLINRPEDAIRTALLALATRHLEPGGRLLVEHHPLDWASTAANVRATPAGQLGMVDVRRDPPFVSAVSVYDVGGRIVRQPFRARVLSDSELADACARAGLLVQRRLSPTWLEAASSLPATA